MKLRTLMLLFVPLLGASLVAISWAGQGDNDDEDGNAQESPIELTAAPAGIQATVKRLTPAYAIQKLVKEHEDDYTLY